MLPYAFVDSIAKMIPKELNITLERALKISPELKKAYGEDPQVKELVICPCAWRGFRDIHLCMRQAL